MDKINIASMFGGNEKTLGNHREININSMFNPNVQTCDHDPEELLKQSKDKKKQVATLYNSEYNSCWEKIYDAAKCNLTYVMYVVPKFNIECELYNSLICLQYIQEKLKQKKIGSHIHTNVKIFISWHDLEKTLHKQVQHDDN